jgi:TrkA domain protein
LTELQNVEGLAIDWLQVRQGAACVGSAIGHVDIEGNVTIVAVIRGDRTYPSPAADFILWPGDTAVAVGTPEGIEKAFTMLQGE